MDNHTKLVVLKNFVQSQMPNLPYHNFEHIKEVVTAVAIFAKELQLTEENRFLLLCAAYLHDIVYVPTAKDNEEQSCIVARRVLHNLEMSDKDIEFVQSLIMATKYGVSPKTLFEQIMKDADLFNLGTNDFLMNNKLVRAELPEMSDEKWKEFTLKFLSQGYYTAVAQKLLTPGLEKNIRIFQELNR